MINLPKTFTIAAIETDYSLTAQDMVFRVTMAQRINAEVEGYHGEKLLSGWHKAAYTKVFFHVSNPLNEQVARASVLAALREINKTERLLVELYQEEDYLVPLITGVPLGCFHTKIERVERKRDRKAAFLWDFIAEITDNWNHKLREVRAMLAEAA